MPTVSTSNISHAPVTAVYCACSHRASHSLSVRLAVLTPARRRAIRFGIETGLTVPEVTVIRWKDAFKLARSGVARRILQEQPLHPKLPYVFWESTEPSGTSVGPLFGLERQVEILVGEYHVLSARGIIDSKGPGR